LRIGERHPGNDVAAGAVDGVATEDDVAGDAGLVLAHVGQQRQAVAVTGGVQPPAGNTPGPEPLIDRDRPARLEPDHLQPDRGGVRPAADGHEDLVGFDHRTVLAAGPARSTPLMRADVMTRIPSASNAARTSSPANGSSRGRSRSSPSTTVTS